MSTTEPPISPEPDDKPNNNIEPDLVDFDEDSANRPFDPEASTLTSMRHLNPEDKLGRDSATKPVPRPGFQYLSVSDESPYHFIFTEPDSKQKYRVSRVDAWTIIDIAADLVAGANVGYYVRNTPPLYNIVANIVNREPGLPKSVSFPIIENNGMVTHATIFPPGPFLLGLRDHTQHLKFNKKKVAAPSTDPAPAPPCNRKPPRQREPRHTKTPRAESSPITSLADTNALDRLLTSSSATGTFLAHSVINYGQTLERDLRRAQQTNAPRNTSRSAPYRRAYRPRPPKARAPPSPAHKASTSRRSPSTPSKHDDTAMQVDEGKLPPPSEAP
ncbi:hypothetical protein PLEOSDRAFT_169295 [Pleurotus ostreatus PC15]|uniref:Uncharacterized protein n=1 Tax=Pleurotus ostreatus (strain PC15) TaxID=1137138 RepID=A0A067NE09_PLEO1|nr:hypothetical protein PLEOSDRAFT_169295 [Pleurotus ostreatus PC15]